jgi:hypothetical protein
MDKDRDPANLKSQSEHTLDTPPTELTDNEEHRQAFL